MMRGWYMYFYVEKDRERVLEGLRKVGVKGIYDRVMRNFIDQLITEVGEDYKEELYKFCEMYEKIPSDDLTIKLEDHSALSSRLPHDEEPRFGIMQLASGGGFERKIKNILRLVVTFEMMKIADSLEIKYKCYSG